MSAIVIEGTIVEGPFAGRTVQVRTEDSQRDGRSTTVAIELEGRMVPLELALQILHAPPVRRTDGGQR